MKKVSVDPLAALTAANPVSDHDVAVAAAGERERTYARIRALRESSARDAPAAAPQRHRVVIALAAALVATAAAVVGITAPWRGGEAFTLDRALAAIGGGPVIHAVVEASAPDAVVLDLTTGSERPIVQRNEYWYDAERSLLRTRISFDETVRSEILETPRGAVSDAGRVADRGYRPEVDAALAGFVTRYRSALRGGTASIVGERIVAGREAVVLRIRGLDANVLPGGGAEEVTVDAQSYRPLTFQYLEPSGRRSVLWRVNELESLERTPALFAAPELSSPRPMAAGGGGGGRELSLDEAATVLGRPALWAGPTVGELKLVRQRLAEAQLTWTDGRRTHSRVLELAYGTAIGDGGLDRDRPFLVISQAETAEDGFTIGFGGRAGAPPPEGLIALRAAIIVNGTIERWHGRMRADGLYVSIESNQRNLIVRAARALRALQR